jgi:hypothetical protein
VSSAPPAGFTFAQVGFLFFKVDLPVAINLIFVVNPLLAVNILPIRNFDIMFPQLLLFVNKIKTEVFTYS